MKINPIIAMPLAKFISVRKRKTIRSPKNVAMFQSRVGKGLSPRPNVAPAMRARVTLPGDIHVGQLNGETALNKKLVPSSR